MARTEAVPGGRDRPSLPYQPALDGLRGAAVLAVIVYHDGYSWASGGFLGVDTFFVLSGFLITSLLIVEWDARSSLGLVRFWGRRIRRLLPALLLVLAAVALYGYLVVPTFELDRLRGDGLASLLYVANWRFITNGQSYFDLFSSASPVRHLWSLAIEEQFYLVWPIVTLACLRLARGRLHVLATVCVVGIALSTLVMAALYSSADPSRAYFGTDSRAHTILIGSLLALVLSRWRPSIRWSAALRWAGTGAALAALIAWWRVSDLDAFYYRGGSVLYACLAAIVIMAVVQPARSVLGRLLSFRGLCWVGCISYGLYLWHYPVNTYVTQGRMSLDGTALNALRLVVTVALATASFYGIERPVRRGVRIGSLTRVWAPVAMALCGIALVAATAGASAPPNYLGGTGFLNRLPCGPAGAELQGEAESAAAKLGFPRLDATTMPRRVLVVGDSEACSLTIGLRAFGSPGGISFKDASVIGCGAAAGQLYSRTEEFPSGTDGCQDEVRALMSAGAAQPTDAIVWLSNWEREDQVVRDRLVRFGTDAGRRLVLAQMETAYRTLRAHTPAPLVLLTVAAPAPADQVDGRRPGARADDRRYPRLNRVLAEFGARHPRDVVVIDLAHRVCPTGPPCGSVHGFNPRGGDGRHLTTEGSVWAARWLLPKLTLLPSARGSGPVRSSRHYR